MERSFRGFGFWTGWFVVVASMVGSGILTNPGAILRTTQNFYAVLIVWTIAGVLALTGTLTLAELASGIPNAGGDYTYVKSAFGKATGFVYGWAMVLVGFAAPVALVATTVAAFLFPVVVALGHGFSSSDSFLVSQLSSLSENQFVLIVSTSLVVIFTVGHSLRHTISSTIQGFTTFFNLVILITLCVIGIVAGQMSPRAWYESAQLSDIGLSQWGSGTILALYAYTGWNAATYLSGELGNAERNLPRSLIGGCITVIALYLMVNVSFATALTPSIIAQLSEGDWNRLAEISISVLLGKTMAHVFSLLMSVGMLACLSAMILTGPRIVHAMAHDGCLPAFAGRLHPKSQIPIFAIVFQGAFSLFFLWSGTFRDVLNFAGYGLGVVGLLTVAPIFVLRKKPTFKPLFKVPFYPWTPILFVAVSFLSLIGAFLETPTTSLLSIVSILVGYPLYELLKKMKRL